MEFKIIKVAITSIGSGVGQSVVDSCRNSQLPMKIYGLGMNPLGFGAYDCDIRLSLPSIYSTGYVDLLLEYCEKFQFDIIIPGLDDELLLLSERIDEFHTLGTQIPIASPELIKICRNKELMCKVLLKISNACVESFNHNYIQINQENLPYPLIAKPNSGFASRGIFVINSKEDLKYIQPTHVIQTLAIPRNSSPNRESFLAALKEGEILQTDEISIQLLFANDGQELGRMASHNKLQNGIPIEIIPIYNAEMWTEIDRLIPHLKKLGLKGPLNIQGRLTNDGFKIFEMNPRFTGITGLRTLMGFNEVESTIKSFCKINTCDTPLIINNRKIGIRQVTDRVVDINRDTDLYKKVTGIEDYPKEASQKLTILITGANGYLGLETVKQLVKSPEVKEVKVLVRKSERFTKECKDFFPKEVSIYDTKEIFNGQLNLGSIDIVCHLASGRTVHSTNEIASSLEFTNKLMIMIGKYHVPAVINISSQAVYGSQKPFWKEHSKISPETSYAQSKWAGELLTKNSYLINNTTSTISLRLSRIIGPTKSMDFKVVPHIFAKKAIMQEPVRIQGGNQKFDYLDVRDAANAIVKLVEIPYFQWPDVLNIGSGKQVSLLEIVELISKISKKKFGKELKYTIEKKDMKLELGMNIDKAKETINWKPIISFEDTILHLLNNLNFTQENNKL